MTFIPGILFSRLLRTILLAAALICSPWSLWAEDVAPAAAPSVVPVTEASAAHALYREAKFAAALEIYKVLGRNAPVPAAVRAGLIRTHLKLQQVDEAHAAAQEAVASEPRSALFHALLGMVRFRRGEMEKAEDSFRQALELNADEPDALIGLADLYWAFSMRGKAYKLVIAARKVAPDDPEVQKAWMSLLRRRPKMQALEAYVSTPKPDDEKTASALRRELAFLKATVDHPLHACRPVNKPERAELELEPIEKSSDRIRGYGLKVRINDRRAELLLDTGARGLMIGSGVAKRAGVVRISETIFDGIGDGKPLSGYIGYADSVRIGDLEFRDCLVRVSSKGTVGSNDGIIGTDVFARDLVHLDLPAGKLRLEPLPKLPDGEEEPEDEETEVPADDSTAGKYPELIRMPRDRYVPPGMEDWSKPFRFGHLLLLFTKVKQNDNLRLFLIDTGAYRNLLSTNLGKEIGSMTWDGTGVRGMKGRVNEVYKARKADLVFGGILQKNQDVLALDLSELSGNVGTEIGGILGFGTLNQLEIKIDYRDGLVKFIHDPKRSPRNRAW